MRHFKVVNGNQTYIIPISIKSVVNECYTIVLLAVRGD